MRFPLSLHEEQSQFPSAVEHLAKGVREKVMLLVQFSVSDYGSLDEDTVTFPTLRDVSELDLPNKI